MFAMRLLGAPVDIGYDSKYAHAVADAVASPTVNVGWVEIASGLIAALKTVSTVRWEHTKAHDGHPWNEHADATCDLSASGKYLSPWVSAPCHVVGRPPAWTGSLGVCAVPPP